MRRDGTGGPRAGEWPGRSRHADIATGAGQDRSWPRSALVLTLIWLLAALLAAPTALALGGMVRPPSAAAPAPGAGTGQAARVPPLRAPVIGPLVRGFEEPAGPFGPGHRGVDLAAAAGTAVLAPAAGRVVFAGEVARAVWASIEVSPGVVITLGPLRALAVSAARQVATGGRVADLAPGHGTAEHPTALHLSLRIDGRYVDPLPWIDAFGRPRLAPLLEPGGPH